LECFEFGVQAFDLAEELQTPILIMSDLDLGMNTWMTPQFEYPSEPLKRGKVLTAEEVQARGFYRYVDVDGDGITYRTLPGNEHPKAAYFNRGTGHNRYGVYSEKSADWVENMERLIRKFETARSLLPRPIMESQAGVKIGFIAYGSTLPAIDEARTRLESRGLQTDALRLRALPINDQVRQFIKDHERLYVVELNRDGQMHQILTTENPDMASRLISLAHLDGLPLTADWLVDQLLEKEQDLSNFRSD
jgi:2-oxoglutarate ferredoxin oxidoreductase subunit alpha